MTNWSEIDAAAPGRSPQVRELLAALESALARPELAARAEALLANVLSGPLDGSTFDAVQSGLTTLLGIDEEEPGRMFAWIAWDKTRERLKALLADAPPAVERFLRDVWATYGDALNTAYRRWRELPDDWDVVHREVYHDLVTGQVRIEITITKFNGEQVRVVGDAASLLTLTTNLLRSLNMVRGGFAFPDALLADFRTQVTELEALVAPPAPADRTPAEASR